MASYTTPSGVKIETDTVGGIVSDSSRLNGVPTAISPDVLTNNSVPLPVLTPSVISPYPVSSIAVPELTATEPEKRAGSLIDSLKALNDSYVGRESFRATKEAEQGIPDLLKTQRELASRVTTLQKEAQAIPLQLQEQFSGTGATTGGLAPIQASALRKNAIQALSASALLEATNGNITLAQNLVDRAVAQKYDPIKEEIDAKTANLNLIINSPEYSIADKNRAQKQQAILEQQKAQVERQAQEEKDIKNLATTIASFGAPTDVLQRVQDARSFDEALLLAGSYAQDPKAKLEIQKLKYETEKARLDSIKAAADLSGKNLNITGNTIKDVASVISSNQVGATTKTTLSAIVGVQSALEDFAKSAKKNGNGTYSISGVNPFRAIQDVTVPFTDLNVLPFRKAFLTPEEVKADTFINGINLKVQQWASGAALTERQTRQVEAMTPTVKDSDEVAIEKTKKLYDFMNNQIRSALISEGIDFPIPTEVDIFNNQDSLSAIFGE